MEFWLKKVFRSNDASYQIRYTFQIVQAVPLGSARLFFCLTFKGGSLTLELRTHDVQSSISFQALYKLEKPQSHKGSRVLLLYKLNFTEMYVLLYISIPNVHNKSYFIEGYVWFGASVPTVQHEVLQS